MQIKTIKKGGIKAKILRLVTFLGFDVPIVYVECCKPKIKIVRRKLK